MSDVAFTVTDEAKTLKVQGQDLQTVTIIIKSTTKMAIH